ncbi:Uncharacterized protein APZ42_000729 [Daphnia magna]|uniref:Secreted protein n=1 Tax=Daphnia magna TaxID=35525 RepID=A0A164JFB9_9CRUS|nr:Uncharacterized protein APZ42_000729 [Daphnia magna]
MVFEAVVVASARWCRCTLVFSLISCCQVTQHGLHVRTETSVPEIGTISRVFIGSVGWSRDHSFKPRSGG